MYPRISIDLVGLGFVVANESDGVIRFSSKIRIK